MVTTAVAQQYDIDEVWKRYKVDQTNQEYRNLLVEHYLTPKLLLTGRAIVGNGDYFEKARKVNGSFDWRNDWVYAFSVGVEYQIQKWLGVSADYTHSRRDSNFDNFDFKDDLVGAKVTLSF